MSEVPPSSARQVDAPTRYTLAGRRDRAVRRLGAAAPVSWLLARVMHHLDRPVARVTRGRHTITSALTGLTVGMLTTTGARSGQPRTVPVLGFPVDEGFVVIASNYGQARHPAWYHNLRAHPRAELVVHGKTRSVEARLTSGEERARLWGLGLAIYPGWQLYEQRAGDREIGVFVLRRT